MCSVKGTVSPLLFGNESPKTLRRTDTVDMKRRKLFLFFIHSNIRGN